MTALNLSYEEQYLYDMIYELKLEIDELRKQVKILKDKK